MAIGPDDRVGVRAVIEGLADYLRGVQQIERANAQMARSAQNTATTTNRSFVPALQTAGVAVTRFGSAVAGLKFGAAFLGIQSASALLGDFVGDTVNAFITFEDTFAGIRKTAQLTEEEFAELEKANRSLAKSIPVTVNELNKFGAIAGQIGTKSAADILKFEETIARLGVSIDGININEAALLLAQFASATQTPISQIDNLSSVIVRLGNELAANEGPIIEFAQRIGGVGKAVGLTAQEIIGVAAAFASVGIEAEAGATAIQNVLIRITQSVNEGGDQLKLLAEIAKTSAADFAATWKSDPAEAFRQFVEGLADVAQEDVFKAFEALEVQDQRLIRAFLALSGSGGVLTQSLRYVADEADGVNALMQESEKRFETTKNELQLLKNEINDNAITLGENLRPALLAMFEVLSIVVQGLVLATDNMGLFILGLGLLGLAIGGPFGILLALSALLIEIALHWDDIKSAAEDAIDAIKNAANAFIGFADSALDSLGPVGEMIRWLIDRVADLIDILNSIPFVDIGGIFGGGGPVVSTGLPAGNIATIENILGTKIPEGALKSAAAFAEWRRSIVQTDSALEAALDTVADFLGTTEGPSPTQTGAARVSPTRRLSPGLLDGDDKKAKEAVKTALDGFFEALAELNVQRRLEEAFGELGAAAIAKLSTAIVEGASASDGAQVVGAIEDLIQDAKDASVPNAQALGDDLVAAITRAMVEKTPDAFDAASAAVQRFTDAIKSTRLETETALNALAETASVAMRSTGDAADSLISSLVNAITTGTPEAVRSFEDQMVAFQQAAKEAGVNTGTDLTDALATAIRDGTADAVRAAVDAIAQIDQAMRDKLQAVEDIDLIGQALVEALRRQAQQAADLARTALEDQAAAARVAAESQIESINQASEAAEKALRSQAEAAEESYRRQIDAAREASDAQIDAVRDQHKVRSREIDDSTDAQIEALQKEKDALQEQQRAERDDRKRTHDERISQIDAALKRELDAIDILLRALDDADAQDERSQLERNLALAYTNQARFDAELALRRFERNQERQRLRDQADALRDGADQARDSLKDSADEEEQVREDTLRLRIQLIEEEIDAVRKQRETEKRLLDDWRDFEIDRLEEVRDAQLRILEEQSDASRKSFDARLENARASYDAQVQAAEDARDQELAGIQSQLDEVQRIYRERTDSFALETEARRLLEEQHQGDIISLIKRFYPEWETSGFSLGQQLVLGLRRSGIQEFLAGVLALLGQITTQVNTLPNPFVTGWGPRPVQGGPPPGTLPNRTVIPGLAQGGIVTSPTLAYLGEGGVPEVVQPLPSWMSAHSVSLGIDLRGSSFTGSPRENASEIRDQVAEMMVEVLTQGALRDGVTR